MMIRLPSHMWSAVHPAPLPRTYDVDTASTTLMPFTLSQSTDFRTGTTGDQTHNHSLIAFDENRLVIAYSYPDSTPTGFIQVITIDPNDGALDARPAVETTDDQGLYNSMVKLDVDTVVLAYRGEDAQGYLNTFDISDNNVITPVTVLEHETERTAYHSIVRVDDDTVVVAYSVIGTSTSGGYGQIRVFDVASDNDIAVRGVPVYLDTAADATFEEQIHLNSVALLDSDTLAVAYRGADAGGFIRLYDINHFAGSLNATAGPYKHDTADGAFNSLVRVDDGTLALVYGGDLPGVIQDTTATSNSIKTLAFIGPDTTPPVIESAGTTSVNTIELVASQALDGTTDVTDFAVSDNTVIDPLMISDSTITITVGTAIVGGNTVTMNYTGITITDVAGNALEMSTFLPVRNNVTDDTAPTVTITSTAADDGGNTNSRIIYYTAVFSEEVTDFGDATSDVTVSGPLGTTVSTPDGTGTTYTFAVTTTTDGQVDVTIPVGAAEDETGNLNLPSATYTVTVVNAGPTVTGVSAVSADNGAYKEGGVIDITITFDEPVTVVDTDGSPTLTLETGDSDAVVAYHSSNPSETELLFRYTVDAGHNSVDLQYVDSDPLALNDGTILAADDSTPASLALPGIASAASLAGGYDVIVDTIAPKFASATAVNVNGNVDIAFDESAFGMPVTSEFRVSGGTGVLGSLLMDSKILLSVSPRITSTSQMVSYNGNSVTDVAGNLAEHFSDERITNNLPDTVAPSPSITSPTVSNGGITNSDTITYNVEFDEIVTGFEMASDIELSDMATATATVSPPDGDGTTYTFTVTVTGDGTVIVFIPANVAEDETGNANVASATYTVTVDRSESIVTSDSLVISDTASLKFFVTATDTPALSDESDIQTMGTLVQSDTPVITDSASQNISITATDTPVISDESDVQTMGTLVQSDPPVITESASLNISITATDAPAISDEPDISDINAPTVVGVSATSNSYKVGDIIGITVTFDEPVTVSDGATLQLLLDIGTTVR